MHLPELTLDFDKAIGKIKPLNGGNLAPPLAYSNLMDISQPFKELRMPYTRLHDAPLDNPGWRIVDFNMIFPFMQLDADDPQNYFFKQTDEYISHCLELGTKVIYRLGPSVEHHRPRYDMRAVLERQWDKWARVAVNIIRHYNEGWGNGFHFNIKYWEIWAEPEAMWDMTLDEVRRIAGLPPNAPVPQKLELDCVLGNFNQFYCHVAQIIKNSCPNIKIGGPAHVRIDANGASGGFLKCCSEHHAPLDFYSWHCYTDNIEFMRDQIPYARALVDSYGYTKTELHLNEWHYVPGSWSRVKPEKKHFMYEYKMKHLDAAAFNTAVLNVWQDTPLDVACYYTATCMSFGLFSAHGVPTKSYYAMKAFGMMADYAERIEVTANDRDLYPLAGRNANGDCALLCSVFHVRGNSVYLKTTRPSAKVTLLNINEDQDLESTETKFLPDGRIELPIATKPSVFLAIITPGN